MSSVLPRLKYRRQRPHAPTRCLWPDTVVKNGRNDPDTIVFFLRLHRCRAPPFPVWPRRRLPEVRVHTNHIPDQSIAFLHYSYGEPLRPLCPEMGPPPVQLALTPLPHLSTLPLTGLTVGIIVQSPSAGSPVLRCGAMPSWLLGWLVAAQSE
jgi:hypothetical protein